MIRYFLIFVLFHAYQPFMHGAARSSEPRPSGLALMRSQPEFRPVIVGYDNNDYTLETVLTEEEIALPGCFSKDDIPDLRRRFCTVLIRGATPELRDKMLKGSLKRRARTNFVARAEELRSNPHYKRVDPQGKLDYIGLAQEDAQEFPDFYNTPRVHEKWTDETLCGQFIEHADPSDSDYEQQLDFSVLVTSARIVILSLTKEFHLSWQANDEEKTLMQGCDSKEGYYSDPDSMYPVMHNKTQQAFVQQFLNRKEIKDLCKKKAYDRVLAALIQHAKTERVKLCGVAILPPRSTT